MFNDSSNEYMGHDGFIWFQGVVEDVKDPEQLGRMRVRILGDHTQDKDLIPTEELPWAHPIMPIIDASMNGIGWSPTQGVVNGTWVIGFYRDGKNKQHPVIFGTIGGLPLDPPVGDVGFNDPDECWPMKSRLEEPDVNRLARGESGGKYSMPHPVTEKRRELVETGMSTCESSWDEPETPYDAKYPYNRVFEGWWNDQGCDAWDWGHIEEWDSTPGAERYLRWHKTSMNFLEIHPLGEEVHKIFGDHFELNIKNKHLLVKGNYLITVEGDRDEHIMGDYCLKVDGNYKQTVGGYKSEKIGLYKSELIALYKGASIGTYYSQLIGTFEEKSIGLSKTCNIGTTDTWNVGALRTCNIGGGMVHNIVGDNDWDVSANWNELVGANQESYVGANIIQDAGGLFDMTAAGLLSGTATSISYIGGGAQMDLAGGACVITASPIALVGSIQLAGSVSAQDAVSGAGVSGNYTTDPDNHTHPTATVLQVSAL